MIDAAAWVSSTVTKAYCALIEKKYQKKVWFTLSGKSPAAQDFMELTKTTGKKLSELMEKAFSFYGPDWCQEKFGNPYPPINIVLGPKCRARLVKELPIMEPMTPEQLEEQAKDLVETLMGSLGLEGALEIVQEGEYPEDKALRAIVLKQLESRYQRPGPGRGKQAPIA